LDWHRELLAHPPGSAPRSARAAACANAGPECGDHLRITRLLQQHPARAGAEAMQELLAASDLVASRAVAGDVVTMYTQVLLQDPGGDAPPHRLTVCYRARPGNRHAPVP
jgi:hypothetical protein